MLYNYDVCAVVCGAGRYYDVTIEDCVPCPMKTYKTAAMKFEECTLCDELYTTDGTGATSAAECDISKFL